MKSDNKNALDSARAELAAKHTAEQNELDRKFAVLAMLPPGQIPIICNWRTPSLLEPRVWVNYSATYPDSSFDPVAILRAMEAHGWSLLPEAALVKWNQYRHCMEPCTLAEAQTAFAPDASTQQPAKKFTDGSAVAPYWVEPSQHTKPDFVCFMRAPDGLVYRAAVDVPGIGCTISARVQSEGFHSAAWHFVRGTGHLHTPKHWPIVPQSRCFVDTEQGISGSAWFHLDNAKKTASEALAFLLGKEDAK